MRSKSDLILCNTIPRDTDLLKIPERYGTSIDAQRAFRIEWHNQIDIMMPIAIYRCSKAVVIQKLLRRNDEHHKRIANFDTVGIRALRIFCDQHRRRCSDERVIDHVIVAVEVSGS